MTRPLLAVVAAIADNGVIGRDNGLAWRLPSDLKRFRALTWGKPMIRGRKTFASIGKPLPGRETVVLTRDPAFMADGVHVARSWQEAVARAEALAEDAGAPAVMVVGGADVYRLALPQAAHLHLTLVHASPEGDVRFPAFERDCYRETGRVDPAPGPGDEHPFTFLDLRRRDLDE